METDRFDSFVEDLLGEKIARPLIIVAASKIEDLLYLILAKYFLNPRKAGDDDLLNGDNPLSTFSARIKICYRLGIMNKDLFDILDKVRKVRNLCAHSIEFNVQKSPVREHLLELRKCVQQRSSFILAKERYFNNKFDSSFRELQCALIAICVVLVAINEKISKTEGIVDTLRISRK
ncbi:MAG TPA: MltR family transcriptional regulator [Mucilaginibacter sp.]|jgi:DNA-binding MltR family transcriptional regulator|nr:MltR family transcriptional regulator [Mucilaginibacter sp.]